MLGQFIAKLDSVNKAKAMIELAGYAHLFVQSSSCGVGGSFPGSRMSAARIGPQTARVILASCPFLEQHKTVTIEEKDRKRPVKPAFTMNLHLFAGTYLSIIFVDEYHILHLCS